jgi:hypothetical protein
MLVGIRCRRRVRIQFCKLIPAGISAYLSFLFLPVMEALSVGFIMTNA